MSRRDWKSAMVVETPLPVRGAQPPPAAPNPVVETRIPLMGAQPPPPAWDWEPVVETPIPVRGAQPPPVRGAQPPPLAPEPCLDMGAQPPPPAWGWEPVVETPIPERGAQPPPVMGGQPPPLTELEIAAPELAEFEIAGNDILARFRELVIHRFGNVELAFQKIDKNNSGSITIAEVLKALSDAGFDKDMAIAVFKEMRPQNVGSGQSTISREDWNRALRKRQTPGVPSGPSSLQGSSDLLLGIHALLAERHGDLKKSFEALDVNKSGQLSAIEFAAGLSRLGVDRPLSQKAFKELSQGRTNTLTLQEWMVGFNRRSPFG
jgi:Ca2+-binding EF-hand superfamily protein